MSQTELSQAIEKVSAATSQSFDEVMHKLTAKDDWTWFLVNQAAK